MPASIRDRTHPAIARPVGRRMCDPQKMLQNSDDLAFGRTAFALAQILDLLRHMLAVEAVVVARHRAKDLGLVLGPGIEIVVVIGAVASGSVGHQRFSCIAAASGGSGYQSSSRI